MNQRAETQRAVPGIAMHGRHSSSRALQERMGFQIPTEEVTRLNDDGNVDCCRVYGPKMAALGKRGRAHANTAIATSKDLICQHILSKRQLPAGKALPYFELCFQDGGIYMQGMLHSRTSHYTDTWAHVALTRMSQMGFGLRVDCDACRRERR